MCIFCIQKEAMRQNDNHTAAICADIVLTACSGIAQTMLHNDGEMDEKAKSVFYGLFNQSAMERIVKTWQIEPDRSVH